MASASRASRSAVSASGVLPAQRARATVRCWSTCACACAGSGCRGSERHDLRRWPLGSSGVRPRHGRPPPVPDPLPVPPSPSPTAAGAPPVRSLGSPPSFIDWVAPPSSFLGVVVSFLPPPPQATQTHRRATAPRAPRHGARNARGRVDPGSWRLRALDELLAQDRELIREFATQGSPAPCGSTCSRARHASRGRRPRSTGPSPRQELREVLVTLVLVRGDRGSFFASGIGLGVGD